MLALRPNCECCDRDLPAASADARICSFECTFCADCAATLGIHRGALMAPGSDSGRIAARSPPD